MGLIRLFRSLIGVDDPPSVDVVHPTMAKEIKESNFNVVVLPDKYFKMAFDHIFLNILMKNDTREGLRSVFLETCCSGKSHREIQTLFYQILCNEDWRWLWLEEWVETFTSNNEWPPNFRGTSFTSKPPTMPGCIVDALIFFTVKELILWAKNNNFKLHANKKRKGVEQFFIQNVPWDNFKDHAILRFNHQLDSFNTKHASSLRKDVCGLLVGSLFNMAYAINRMDNMDGVDLRGWKWTVHPDDSSYAREAAEAFNCGLSTKCPPFYPGDRSYLKGSWLPS